MGTIRLFAEKQSREEWELILMVVYLAILQLSVSQVNFSRGGLGLKITWSCNFLCYDDSYFEKNANKI